LKISTPIIYLPIVLIPSLLFHLFLKIAENIF